MRDRLFGVTKTPSLIMVVDDEPNVIVIMTRVLDAAGHKVIGCKSCDEVQARLDEGLRPAMAITDVVLDGCTGKRVASILRRVSPRTRVVFMSGYDNVALPSQQRVLLKPFAARELVELVEQVLSAEDAAEALQRGEAFELSRKKRP